MKHYLLQIQQLTDGTEPKAVFAYNDYDECLSAFYLGISSSIANTNISSCIFAILDKNGTTVKIERWYRPEAPNPETTE